LPARAYYAAPYERKDAFDDALFQAAWVEGLDVNEVNTVRWAAEKAELDPDGLLEEARSESAAREASAALAEFDRLLCPGVPTVVLDGSRYYGKDRLDWILEHVSRIQHQAR
jgi:2-hydroxychromene-2-carboxylate isomerase